MSFGLHLFLAIVWALLTLVILGLGVWALFAGLPALLPVSCFAITALSSFFIYNDVKSLFFNKNTKS